MTKAQELRKIVIAEQQMYEQTRPQDLADDLFRRMTILARQRFSSMTFVFSDDPSVIKEALAILKREGFKISHPGATPSTVKLEW
jgi:hypothetical protein